VDEDAAEMDEREGVATRGVEETLGAAPAPVPVPDDDAGAFEGVLEEDEEEDTADVAETDEVVIVADDVVVSRVSFPSFFLRAISLYSLSR
jgi:hypothetical protein